MSDKFRLFFDSSAKTKKAIEEELKRLIRSKISDVVDEAVRDAAEVIDKTTGGEKIPPRRVNISYATGGKTGQTISPDELAYAPEAPEASPLTETIRRMRELGQTFYNGYMLRQCAELSIVKQGEFVKDVTDDFTRTAFCAIERPVYGALSIEQLRTYFTWRTDVRRGAYNKIDKPYVMLYCYELMNKIGVLSSQDAFNKLITVWENCRSFCIALDALMPIWLKDFYAFNEIEGDFSRYEETFPKRSEQSDKMTSELHAGNYSGKLEYLMSCSAYNLKGSIFMNEKGSAELMDRALEAVLNELDKYFRAREISLFELLCGRSKKDFGWSPFASAYVNLDRMDGFHACRISPTERYGLKRGQPCREVFEHMPYRSFIGYILKATEEILRKRTGFRYSISANLNPVLEDFMNREKLHRAASEPEFQNIIPNAVHRWCDENGIFPKPKEKKKAKKNSYEEEFYSLDYGPTVPPEVKIDIEDLSRIRREAEETARKLIIDEEPEGAPAEEDISTMISDIEDDVFEERTEQASFEVHSQYDFSTLPDGWRELAQALDPNALEFIRAVYNGTAEELCRTRGTLPEAESEQINDLALTHVGDILIENGELIPDYLPDAERIIRIIS